MHSPPLPCSDGLMLNLKKLTSRKLQGALQQTHHLSSFLSTKNLKMDTGPEFVSHGHARVALCCHPLNLSKLRTHTHTNLSGPMITSLPPVDAENPCPEQGDIIQIKLSEHTEVLPKADGTGSTTMLVDTVFEMNYSTGQWTRLKKYKPITNTS